MDARRANQVWLAGGIAAIILLVLGTWFLLISPKLSDTDAVQAEADDVNIQLLRLNKEVAKLAAEDKKRATHQASVDELAANLPESYGEPDFLRMLQTTGAATNVTISNFTAGDPAASATVPTAVEVPITLTATGTQSNVDKFLVSLQSVQDRAVLVTSVSLSSSTDADNAGRLNADLNLTAFCTTAKIDDSDGKPTGSDACKAGS
ncbi:type 4a pilus biogenesis protein PilO [Paractinoplanes atraurantiacus]|uniref:Tfp pilus assembly protein PilO n=1 Tax=Paractinoplanes atraurantiacus TaxID=1036182 RepID=A0A285H0Z6_9ACTN|nr:type 4a pilus biogenesis protein PilO [Actinoplanes atraurantiacus]SNY29244.1 Tfp pilus assembly protein PilO [Actinoplanes atraurantiacus]